MGDAYLKLLDEDVYEGLDPSRGPWDERHYHAGLVAGAIARSVERAGAADKALTRLTLDLIRPIPLAGFRVSVEATREGRKIATYAVTLSDLEGKTCVTGSALMITPAEETPTPTAPVARELVSDAAPGGFPISVPRHDRPVFSNFVNMHYPPGEDNAPGPTRVWMRTPPLIAGEAMSPFQRICPLADSGNAIARNADVDAFSFINPDLTIVMHRATEADWLLSEAVSHWRPNGIGLAEARLSDEDGPVATALQSLIVTPVK